MNTPLIPSRARAQRGMTLIELLIAMLLGVVLMAGVIQIFSSNRAAYAFNEGYARLQENGRFAMDTLSFHARMAGYLGCLSTVTLENNLENTDPLAFNFEQGLFGYEAAGTAPGQTFAPLAENPANSNDAAEWIGNLAASLLTAGAIPGSDVLVIRHASSESHTLLSPFNDADSVVVDAPGTEFSVGEIGVVSDCQKASIFQITATAEITPGVSLSHTEGTLTPGNALGAWDTDQQYSAGAEMRRAETWIYYVGASDDGPPALFQRRLQLDGTTMEFVDEELVEAVDTMQIRYGIDQALDGAVDRYETADAVVDWNTVVALRIGLLLRSPDAYGTEYDTQVYDVNGTAFDPFNDRRVRESVTTTIALRNRLP